jgi:hypothetical protein
MKQLLTSIIRLLSEAEDHNDDHLSEDDKRVLNTIKIVIIIFMLLAGFAVFFPFLDVVKDRKRGCCKG